MCEPRGICMRRVYAERGWGGTCAKETATPHQRFGGGSLLRVRPNGGQVSVQKQLTHLLGKRVGPTPVPRGAASVSQ